MAKKSHAAKRRTTGSVRKTTAKKARGAATDRWDVVTDTLANGGTNLVIRNGKTKRSR